MNRFFLIFLGCYFFSLYPYKDSLILPLLSYPGVLELEVKKLAAENNFEKIAKALKKTSKYDLNQQEKLLLEGREALQQMYDFNEKIILFSELAKSDMIKQAVEFSKKPDPIKIQSLENSQQVLQKYKNNITKSIVLYNEKINTLNNIKERNKKLFHQNIGLAPLIERYQNPRQIPIPFSLCPSRVVQPPQQINLEDVD